MLYIYKIRESFNEIFVYIYTKIVEDTLIFTNAFIPFHFMVFGSIYKQFTCTYYFVNIKKYLLIFELFEAEPESIKTKLSRISSKIIYFTVN